jgi:hypothetical protein
VTWDKQFFVDLILTVKYCGQGIQNKLLLSKIWLQNTVKKERAVQGEGGERLGL